MGIVQRQGLKNTIVRFAGVLVGILSMLYVYPLNDGIYGYAQFLYNTALFFVPFISIGFISLAVKFFPEFSKDSANNNGLLSYLLSIGVVLYLIFLGIVSLFKKPFYAFLERLKMDVEIIQANELNLAILTFLLMFTLLFIQYVSNYGRIAFPTFLNNFLFKIFLPLVVLAFVFEKLSEQGVANYLLYFFGALLFMMILYAKRLGALKLGWNFKFLTLERIKRMAKYMIFGAFNSIGSVLTFRIDAIMITTLLSVTSTGLFFKILIMANVIDIPTNSINKIAGPIISKSWEEGDIDNIKDIYKKASVNLLIAGFAIFLVGWFTIENLFAISINPDSFEGGKMIFLFLAMGKLLDMLTSVNGAIIIYSKSYQYNLLFILLLGVTNVILNYYLIGEFNIMGAAIASAIALFLYNLIKLIFIYFKFGMHPFSKPIFTLFMVAGIVFAIFSFIPTIDNPFISIILNGGLIALIYGLLVYYLKISEEANGLIDKYLGVVFKK